jgi:hypothetical protein
LADAQDMLVRAFLAAIALLFFLTSPARASPTEDALVDGDIDLEDVTIGGTDRSERFERQGGNHVLGQPRAPTYVSLVGFTSIGPAHEIGGMLMVGIPFDRVVRGNTRTTSFVNVVAPEPNGGPPSEVTLTPRFARSCVDASWRAAGIGSDDSRLDGIVSRAHWSALLPETRLRAIRYDNASLFSSLDPVGTPTYFHDSGGTNVGLEGRLTWKLDRLVYSEDEPALERVRLEQRDARSRIATHTLEMLFHWQRAQLDLRTMPPSQVGTRDEADVVLRIMEAEAALDVLTNGWFTAHKPKRGVSSAI